MNDERPKTPEAGGGGREPVSPVTARADVIDALPMFVAIISMEGIVLELNRTALRFPGCPGADAVGRSMSEMEWWHEGSQTWHRFTDAMETAARGDAVRYDEQFLIDGARRFVALSINPFSPGDEDVKALVVTAQDETAWRHLSDLHERRSHSFERTFRRMRIGMAYLDGQGGWTRVNPALCRMLGFEEAELLQLELKDLLPPNPREGAEARLHRLLCERLPTFSIEKELVRKDGQRVWLNLTSAYDAGGGDTQYVLFAEETTRFWSQEHELSRLRREAAASQRVKRDFLASISHELRTPMNAVIGMTELALEEDPPPPVDRYLELARSSAKQLLRLLNDLLDFSRLDVGRFKLEVEAFRIGPLVEDAVRGYSGQAFEKGLELTCRIAPDVPEAVLGDPTRVRQIVTNLVSNAVKFTEDGEIAITLSRSTHDRERLRLEVRDTGSGISEADQGEIFAPFSQADSSSTRRHGGSGLGLAIVSELVGLMGGEIGVDSEIGAGSTFHCTMRLEEAPPEALVEEAEEITGELPRDARALVVDDHATNRLILGEMLAQLGFEVIAAESGEEALARVGEETASQRSLDVILLDAYMPEMDGFSVARRLREDPVTERCVVMMLSSGHRDAIPNDVPALDAYLEKPVTLPELRRALLRALNRGGPRRTTRRRGPLPPPARTLRILSVDDVEANQVLVSSILRRRGHEVESVPGGREALSRLGRGAFDVVLLDVQMPEMDGYETCRRLRRRERGTSRRIPVIAMTAHAMAGDRERCLEAGMDHYLAKPVDARELVETVEAAAEGIGAASPGPSVGEEPEEDQQLYRAAALARLGGDEELLQEMLRHFREDVPTRFRAAEEALAGGDLRTYRREMHSVKGLAATIGDEAVRRLAEAAELASPDEAAHRLERLSAELARACPGFRSG